MSVAEKCSCENSLEATVDSALRTYDDKIQKCNTIGCAKINLWCAGLKIEPANQSHRYSIQIIEDSFILACVHLQSDMHFDHKRERLETIRQMMSDINILSENKGIWTCPMRSWNISLHGIRTFRQPAPRKANSGLRPKCSMSTWRSTPRYFALTIYRLELLSRGKLFHCHCGQLIH